jgi:hypothetical protein
MWESRGVSLSFKHRRLLALAVVAFAMLFALPRFLTHTPYQRLGVRLDWNTPSQHPRVTSVVGPPGEGLLLRDDLILTVDGQQFTRANAFQSQQADRKLLARGPFELKLQRGGDTLTLTVPPLVLAPWQRVKLYLFPLITVIAAPIVATLLVWRRPDLTAAWVFLLFAVLEALATVWQLYRFPQADLTGAMAGYVQVYSSIVLWLPASFLHFMMVFPRPRWEGRRRISNAWWWLVVLGYAIPGVLLAAKATAHVDIKPLELWFQAVAFPLGSLSLIERYVRPSRRLAPPALRERVLATLVAVILFLATAINLLPEDPGMMALFSLPLMQLFSTALFFAWLTTPFLIAYLIANDPAFDPRRLIARSIPYAILSGLLAALYLGLVLLGQRYFAATTGDETLIFNVVAALVVAFLFLPLRERIQNWLDRLYGRDPMALRDAFDQCGRELLSALDAHEVRRSVGAAIEQGLRRPVAIEWPEAGMPRLVDEVDARARGAIEALLVQAGIRLEKLSLQSQRATAERSAAELREAATRAELRALRSQVHPHFLFNALNALAYLIETEPGAAQRFTERLADMLRYTVEAGERTAALLSDEIGFVEDYLGVARERYDNAISFRYTGSEDLLSCAVPPLLLQPLVENSLKHGCAADGRPLHLALEAERDAEWLTLRFVDDGAPSGRNGRGLGVGLENLEQRVRHFGGADASVEAGRVDGGGFAVTLRWRAVAAPGTVEKSA